MKALFILDCQDLQHELEKAHSKIKKSTQLKALPEEHKIEKLLVMLDRNR
jgi:hypothetical protein